MRVTFLGFTVPDEIARANLTADPNPQVQTTTFAHAVLGAVTSAGVTMTLLSTMPVSSYPGQPRLLFRSRRFVDGGAEGQLLGFVNVLGVKQLTRLVQCLTRGTARLRRWRPDVLLVHGVHTPFLAFGLLVQRVLDLPVAVILTDPPGVALPDEGSFRRRLHAFDRRLARAALIRVRGVVALTAALASDFAPGVPALVLEGICSSVPVPRTTRSDEKAPLLVYAGGLSRSYGVDLLVDAVLARADGTRLQLYGRGELSDWLDEVARKEPRVLPVQFVPREEVALGYAAADVLVQPRPVNQDFVPYSFPSKLIEFLASGVPVLSTRLPGIPADYEAHLDWIEDDSAAGVNAALDALLAVPADQRRLRAQEAARFVVTTRSQRHQGERLATFLHNLTLGDDDVSASPPPDRAGSRLLRLARSTRSSRPPDGSAASGSASPRVSWLELGIQRQLWTPSPSNHGRHSSHITKNQSSSARKGRLN
ncbi:glycosyltransferase [uncultured Friedmanniella sp.]|uniref:glycosyltransferase n=1 Tax=uncultured Friedmanniella sp. TaxID=335381 RepID=UPI0035C9F73A